MIFVCVLVRIFNGLQERIAVVVAFFVVASIPRCIFRALSSLCADKTQNLLHQRSSPRVSFSLWALPSTSDDRESVGGRPTRKKSLVKKCSLGRDKTKKQRGLRSRLARAVVGRDAACRRRLQELSTTIAGPRSTPMSPTVKLTST